MSEMKITILCCHYTNQATAEDFAGIPAKIEVKRYPCSGKIEVADILRALEDDAEGVLVAGCEKSSCHNRSGSQRAEKRTAAAQKILEEIGMEPERVQMAFVPRLETGVLVEATKRLFETLLDLKSKEGTSS
ncbi:MAG: hydrogenase iron-sulfur subunit [Thermodesulfobacteria bacterium]|nr:hydrogenase iron-sulfur subunit [Thermodesulfobacteriota bacterium]